MNEALKGQLAGIGLGEYEAGVYLALAEQSPSSAAAVAKKLNLSRSTVYTALERLIAKGLVGTSYRNEIKQFIASPASAIGDLLQAEERDLKRRMGIFEGLAEHLKLISKGEAGLPNIIFFEGKESLKKIYLGMLRSAPRGSVMRTIRDEFVWNKEWSFIFEDEWNGKVRRLRSEHDVSTLLLVNDSEVERRHQKYYRQRKHLAVRRLPKRSSVKAFVVYILGGTASILSMEERNLVGIRITNRHIAANFEKMFDAVWASSKDASRS